MKYWFTSDNHFGHANIIKFCNRPFKNAGEMDQVMIDNWNSRVMPDDIIYNLGDFCMGDPYPYLKRLNGEIRFIKGGHDKHFRKDYKNVTQIKELETVNLNGNIIVLCHYALRVWDRSHFNSWQLHGHSHGRLPSQGKQYDVGVDGNEFKPLSLDEIIVIMREKPNNINYIKK